MIPSVERHVRERPKAYGFALLAFSVAGGAFFAFAEVDGMPPSLRPPVITACLIVAMAGIAGAFYLSFGTRFNVWCDAHFPKGSPKTWADGAYMFLFLLVSGGLCWVLFPAFRTLMRLGLQEGF